MCTKENPGQTIEKLFWEPINSGEIAQHYEDIVTAIKERGKDPSYGNGKVPEIVFTTYHHPLPAGPRRRLLGRLATDLGRAGVPPIAPGHAPEDPRRRRERPRRRDDRRHLRRVGRPRVVHRGALGCTDCRSSTTCSTPTARPRSIRRPRARRQSQQRSRRP
ncbi:MAG: hypothetical protein U5R31_15005 [Acidimicrobiia bacterium]|nr:hypothetical protein [Acidimicrobiia bacterium]